MSADAAEEIAGGFYPSPPVATTPLDETDPPEEEGWWMIYDMNAWTLLPAVSLEHDDVLEGEEEMCRAVEKIDNIADVASTMGHHRLELDTIPAEQ